MSFVARSRRRLHAFVGGTLAAGLLCALLLGASCGGPPTTRLELGELRVRRVETPEPAMRPGGVAAQEGDWMIEGPALRVVVGGLAREGEARGAILEAAIPGASEEESLVLLSPRVHVGPRRYAVRATRMVALERRGRPVLRIDGEARIDGEIVDVARELTIGRSGSDVSMTSRIAPRDGRALQVRAGARIGWGGATPWLPGVGPVEDATWHDGPFVAGDGRGAGTVFGVHDGPVRMVAEYELHGQARFLLHGELMGPTRTATNSAPAYERSTLAISQRGIAEAARRFGVARGAPFPELRVVLPYAPPGSEIRVKTDASALPVMRARPDVLGIADIPLPPVGVEPDPELAVDATAIGHAPSESVRFRARSVQGPIALEIPRGGRIRITARDAATGLRIPARARILGERGTPTPMLGPDWSASGAGDAVILALGEVVVPVPTGRYRVVVTHGPEWSLHEAPVEVSETFRPDVQATLRHAVEPGDWVPCELHLHASPSPDSEVPLDDRVASLVAEGIRFAVPTDHNIVTSYAPAIARLALTPGTLGTVSGIEATTDLPVFGHFNAFPVPLVEGAPGNGAVPFEGTTPTALFAALRALGPDVLVQVNHPRLEGGIGYFEQMGYAGATGAAAGPYSDDFDLLEVWNGYDLARPDTMLAVFTEWLGMLGRGRRVVATGNSDSHKIRYVWAGYPRTYVRTPGGRSEPADVLAGLRAGRAFVTSGPFLEANLDDAGPGDVAIVRDGVARVRVVVRAPDWMALTRIEIWHEGAIVRSEAIPAPGPAVTNSDTRNATPSGARRDPRRSPSDTEILADLRFEATLDVPITQDGYVVVLVRGDRPMDLAFGRSGIPPLAFTNPIWLDVDGDGIAPDPGDPRPSPGTFEAVDMLRYVDAGGESGVDAGDAEDAGDADVDAGDGGDAEDAGDEGDESDAGARDSGPE
jgi:hypothetical protein